MKIGSKVKVADSLSAFCGRVGEVVRLSHDESQAAVKLESGHVFGKIEPETVHCFHESQLAGHFDTRL